MLDLRELKVKYITDEAGTKRAVILPIEEFEALMQDPAVVAERCDTPRISHGRFVAELKAVGLYRIEESGVDQDQVLREFVALPLGAQRQVADYIAFLRTRYEAWSSDGETELGDLADEAFVGMWQDREGMRDSVVWVRSVQRREWGEQRN
jgi:hypothetical protein